jgi:hypothetical protein
MIRTIPQWQQNSHCAVDICVSSLSCSNEKTNDRSIDADQQCSANNQRVRSTLFICSILLSRKEEPKKKVTAIKNGKPTMTDQHLYTRRCTQCGGRSPSCSIKSPSWTFIEQFKLEIFLGKKTSLICSRTELINEPWPIQQKRQDKSVPVNNCLYLRSNRTR